MDQFLVRKLHQNQKGSIMPNYTDTPPPSYYEPPSPPLCDNGCGEPAIETVPGDEGEQSLCEACYDLWEKTHHQLEEE